MTRPTLLILSFSPIERDARVLKQVELLRERYEVATCGYGAAPEGVARHLRVPDELPIWRYDRLSVVLRRFAHAYRTNPALAEARRLLAGARFDIVLANDVDAVGLALELEPTRGVHADLHEYAPRQKEENPRWRRFVAPLVRWMCREHVRRAASVTTVGEAIAAEYGREFGIAAEVVTNAAPYSALSPTAVSPPLRLVHSGACLRARGLDLVVAAVEQADAEVTLDLFLTPNDPAYLAELRDRAAASERLTLHDPVPYARLSETLNAHDVGIHLLPPVNFNNAMALPNKLFDYVQARLGVLIGPSPAMAEYVERYGFGRVAADFTVEALAREIEALSIASVVTYKAASDAAARELSSEAQVAVWDAAISRLGQPAAS